MGPRARARTRALRLRGAGASRARPQGHSAARLAGAGDPGAGDPPGVLRARRARQRASSRAGAADERGGRHVRGPRAARRGDRCPLRDSGPRRLWCGGRLFALGFARGDDAPADRCAPCVDAASSSALGASFVASPGGARRNASAPYREPWERRAAGRATRRTLGAAPCRALGARRAPAARARSAARAGVDGADGPRSVQPDRGSAARRDVRPWSGGVERHAPARGLAPRSAASPPAAPRRGPGPGEMGGGRRSISARRAQADARRDREPPAPRIAIAPARRGGAADPAGAARALHAGRRRSRHRSVSATLPASRTATAVGDRRRRC